MRMINLETMWRKKSFTLTELLVVIVAVGVLAALALPNYTATKEKVLDREAKASLALIRAAEKVYRMEHLVYFPAGNSTIVTSDINSFLKVSLPENVTRLWSISLNDTTTGFATATRVGLGADGRQWTINFSGETDPCAGAASCP